MHSIGEWKKLIEAKKSEYIANVQQATSKSHMIHDQVVGSWVQEISLTNQTLSASMPDMPNSHDKQIMNTKINELRLEFVRQKQKLEQETKDRIQQRNKEFETQTFKCKSQIKKLEESIVEYGTRLQTT